MDSNYHRFIKEQTSKRTYEETYSFLFKIYHYYVNGGFLNIIISHILNMITVFIIGLLIFILCFCINYSAISSNTYKVSELFVYSGDGPLFLFIFLYTMYFTLQVIEGISKFKQANEVRQYLKFLNFDKEQYLNHIPWGELVSEISRRTTMLERNDLTPLDLIRIMLNKENYIIALFSKKVITTSLPYFPKWKFTTKIFEWGLRHLLDTLVFDESGRVRSEYLDFSHHTRLAEQLKKHSKFLGIVGLIISPFLFCILMLNFFITYVHDLRQSPQSLGLRTWSPLARWRFRDYNEVDHLFEERLARAYSYATKYVDQFENPIVTTISNFGTLILGSLLGSLLVISIINDNFINYELFFGRSVLFTIGILSAAIAFFRSLMKKDDYVFEANELFKKIAEHAHYFTDNWIRNSHKKKYMRKFSTYFRLKVVIYLEEILSVFITPILFIYTISELADDIVSFMRNHTTSNEDRLARICNINFESQPQEEDDEKLRYSVIGFELNYSRGKRKEG